MRESPLSSRYAAAFAEVAHDHGELESVRADLLRIAGAVEASRRFRTMLHTARMSRAQKMGFFAAVADRLGLSARALELLQFLVRKKREALLPQIAEGFAREADRRLGIQRARVVAAAPLNAPQKEALVARLRELTGARITLEEEIDESLIAGFRVSLDGRVYDGSLRAQLGKLKERLAHGARAAHTA